MTSPLLQLSAISKNFGGLNALSEVNLHIQRGEIYGLIGPNGAGKTTLFNVITGLYQASSGQFEFNGHRYQSCKPHVLAQAGIARTFQNIRLFANLSALENVMIGRHVRTKAGVFGALLRNKKTRDEELAITQRAEELLRYVGITKSSHTLAKHLSYGEQRRLEIARAGDRTFVAGTRRTRRRHERHRNREPENLAANHTQHGYHRAADRA